MFHIHRHQLICSLSSLHGRLFAWATVQFTIIQRVYEAAKAQHDFAMDQSIRIAQLIVKRQILRFLLPWSVELNVNTEQWVRELQYLGVNPSERTMRNMQQGIQRGKPESREKVKVDQLEINLNH